MGQEADVWCILVTPPCQSGRYQRSLNGAVMFGKVGIAVSGSMCSRGRVCGVGPTRNIIHGDEEADNMRASQCVYQQERGDPSTLYQGRKFSDGVLQGVSVSEASPCEASCSERSISFQSPVYASTRKG